MSKFHRFRTLSTFPIPSIVLRRILWFTFALLLGCGGPKLPLEPLEPIPFPDLSAAEIEVRRQLGAAREDWLAMEADPKVEATDRAAAVGSLGELYQAYDLTEAAAAGYRNARRLAPDASRWPYLLGVLHRFEGELETARDQLQDALELNLDDAATRLHLAWVFLDLGELDAAQEQVEAALALATDLGAARALEGRIALQRDDHQGAAEAFEAALAAQPQANRLHYFLGRAYRKLGDLDAAKRHLSQHGTRDAAFADPRLASIYARLAGSAALMQRGASAKQSGALEASVDIYRRAVEGDPSSPEARRDLGALLAQIGRYDEAAEQYQEAVRLEPEKGLNHFVLALVREQLGDSRAVLEGLRQAVDLEPGYREFRFAYASRLARVGDLNGAQQQFQMLLNNDPDDLDVRLEGAKVELALGNVEVALVDATEVEAASLLPKQKAEALTVRADGLIRRNQPDAARQGLLDALEMDPSNVGAHFSLGNLSGMSGDFEAARHHYRTVTEADPERVAAWLGEATALVLLEQEAEAVARLEVAIQQLPDVPNLRFSLARLFLESKQDGLRDPQRALAMARQLWDVQKTPQHADLLIDALASTGSIAEAIDMQRQMLQAAPGRVDPRVIEGWKGRLARLESAR